MADQQKEKSPEELGEAVGRKIEALFGGLFDDEATQLLEADQPPKQSAPASKTAPATPKRPDETTTLEIPPPFAGKESLRVVEPAAQRKPVPAQAPSLRTLPSPDRSEPFEDVAELIEALILNLEWEVTPEVIDEVAERFKALDSHFPSDQRARSVLSMNYRVLQRFKNPDGASHPSLVKMLQDSLTVLKLMRSSPANRQSIDSLFASISGMYKVIVAATEPAPAQPVAKPAQPAGRPDQPTPKPVQTAAKSVQPVPSQPGAKPARPAAAAAPTGARAAVPPVTAPKATKSDSAFLRDRMEAAITSLEEMGRRISKIVGVLRQDGEVTGEEITTETLERLVAVGDRSIGMANRDGAELHRSLLKNTGSAIQSLEEVGQRFSRILGVFRQGGDMSGEEIIRRLGTLEQLFSDRLGQVSAFHKELSDIPVLAADGEGGDRLSAAGGKSVPDGLLTLVWAGTPLAVPSSIVSAVFPMTKAQSEQIRDKASLILEGRAVQRLPLKKPPTSNQQGEPVPAWLVHITIGQKDFFLLAERSLGYRRAPKGIDVTRQARITIAGTSYAVLNQAAFR